MQLVVQSGSEPGRTYDIAASQKIRMGRQSGNDVVVPDEQVSRRHAEIEERNGGLVVTDLGSSNGTFVNGTRITSPQSLTPGDTVQVGTTVLKVVGSPAAGGAGDYDQGATQVSGYKPSGQDYGGYGSPAAPSAPAANDYGQSGGYGQPSGGYGQSPAYGGSASSYDQGQNAYGGSGSSSAAPSYGGGAGSSYDQGQNAYGAGQGAGSYGQQSPSSYDQGQNAYGGSGASATPSYGGAGGSYDPANPGAAAGGYGGQQGSYGQQASQSPYGQSGASYDPANPSAGAYSGGGQGSYDPANPGAGAYGQQGGYNQGQPAYGGQQAYGQPQGQYTPGGYQQPAAAVAPAKKGGLPLPFLIIGIVVVLVILGVLAFFLFFNKGGGTAIGSDIPNPPNSTKLDVSAQDIAKIDPTANQQDISKINYGFFTSTDTPATILTFYQTEMKNRGWTPDTTVSDTSQALFKKGDNNTGVAVVPMATQEIVTGFETTIPALKGKLKVGQTLVIVASGPASVFKTTPGA